MKSFFLMLSICLFIFAVSNAQEGIRPKVYNVNDGLSQGMIFDIIQSQEGYLWIGTKDGLNRYDGYNFHVFELNHFDSFAIGGGEVRKLFEDSRGWIWINYLNGLDVLDSKSGRFFHLAGSDFPILTGFESKLSPLKFAEDASGAIWITDFDRLWRIELTEREIIEAIESNNAYPRYTLEQIPLPELQSQAGKRISAKSVYYSKSHGLIVGTSHGLFHVDTKDYALNLVALPDAYVNIVGEDNTGAIWLKKMTGHYASLDRTMLNEDDDLHGRYCMYVWDGISLNDIEMCTYYPNLVHIQEGKFLWTLMGNQLRQWTITDFGIDSLQDYTQSLTELNETNFEYKYLSFITDDSGILWLATNGYGKIKLNPTKPKFNSYLAKCSQRAIYEDEHRNLYTASDPLSMHPLGDFNKSVQNPLAPSIDVLHMQIPTVFASSGNAWGNTNSGQLFKFNTSTGEIKKFPFHGLGLIMTRTNSLVSVDPSGLVHFDPMGEKIVHYPFQDLNISGSINLNTHQLYESADGVIWIFAFEGLIRAIRLDEGYEYTHFINIPQNQKSISSNSILCVADDPLYPSKYLWIGTKGGGLNRLDKKKGVFTQFKTEHGLPNNVVYGILPDDDGHIWMSTNKGLSRFNVREETFKNFTIVFYGLCKYN